MTDLQSADGPDEPVGHISWHDYMRCDEEIGGFLERDNTLSHNVIRRSQS